MNNYNFAGTRPSIDMNEVSSVRELIFNRAKEKSTSMAKDKNDDYTASVQNDVMSEARASISNSRKQFGVLTKGFTSVGETDKPVSSEKEFDNTYNIPQNYDKSFDTTKLKHNIQNVDSSVYTASMQDEAMNAARTSFSKKSSLMASLKFLNTQAAIRMVNGTHSQIK